MMSVRAGLPVVLCASLVLSACARPCPSLTAPARVGAGAARLEVDAGRGEVVIEVAVRDEVDGTAAGGVAVGLQCSCLSAPLRLVTGDDGVARATGLPAGRYTIAVEVAPSIVLSSTYEAITGAEKIRVVRTRPGRPRVVRGPASALPPGIALRYEQTGCLGDCPAFVAWLADDGRVRLEHGGRTSTWQLGAGARGRSLQLARCLGGAPSYDARVRTDFPRVVVTVRHDDGVAVCTHDRGDTRAPRELKRLEEALVRALQIRRHLARSSNL